MVNRPKQIGTAAETAVLRILLPYFPEARRNVQHGAHDQGDIFTESICWEVKGGNQARGSNGSGVAPRGMLTDWMRQTEAERLNAGATIGVLVMQRAGFGAQRAEHWWACLRADQFGIILGGHGHAAPAPVRLELRDLLSLLADNGWCPDAA